MARVGIFGGSFNPPHTGHLLAAQEFRDILQLDQVLLIPAGTPPHKHLADGSPDGETRLALTEAMVAGKPYLAASDLEVRREGKSYTADTLAQLRAQRPADSFFLLVGTDMFLSLHTWSRPEIICRDATICLALREEPSAAEAQRIAAQKNALQLSFGARVVEIQNKYLVQSSSTVRRMLHFDCAQSYLTPEVLEMIRQKRLYDSGVSLKNLPFDELCERSLALHKKSRRAHVQGCSDTARALAIRWGANPTLAARAGMLHDITKALDKRAHLALCEKYQIALRPFEIENDKLLHSKSGAAVAGGVFGECSEITDAIFWHTTGKAHMTLMEKIIYLADYMEPNRDFEGVDELRMLTWNNLDRALLFAFELSVQLLEERGRAVDEYSREALDDMRRQLGVKDAAMTNKNKEMTT